MNRLIKYSALQSELDKVSKSEIAILLALGYSNKYIIRSVRVSQAQISRVVRQTGIKRKDYRDGKSAIAQHVATAARSRAKTFVRPKLLAWEERVERRMLAAASP